MCGPHWASDRHCGFSMVFIIELRATRYVLLRQVYSDLVRQAILMQRRDFTKSHSSSGSASLGAGGGGGSVGGSGSGGGGGGRRV